MIFICDRCKQEKSFYGKQLLVIDDKPKAELCKECVDELKRFIKGETNDIKELPGVQQGD